jgi:hypothetical protein
VAEARARSTEAWLAGVSPLRLRRWRSGGGTHDLDGQHLLDGSDGVEIFPKSFGKFGVFGGFFGPDTVLGGEEAELEVIAGGAGLTFWSLGLQDSAALSRLASICAADVMGNLLFCPRIGWPQKWSSGSRL